MGRRFPQHGRRDCSGEQRGSAPSVQGGSRQERDQEGPEGLEGVEHILSPPPAQVVFTTVLQPTSRVREERGKSVATCSCSAHSGVSASKATTAAPLPEGFVERIRELLRESPPGFLPIGRDLPDQREILLTVATTVGCPTLPSTSSDRGATRLARLAQQPGWGGKRNRERPFRHPFSRARSDRKLAQGRATAAMCNRIGPG